MTPMQRSTDAKRSAGAAWSPRTRRPGLTAGGCSDVEVEGDAGAQQALRFALYHLNSAANPADEQCRSAPAR